MITIVRGNEKIVCSVGTYEEQYKQLGYLPLSEKASTTKKEAAPKVASSLEEKEVKEEDNEKEKLSEKYGLKSKKSTTTKKEAK